MLAGISVDYVTRLEQGRAVRPSAQVVDALARTLRLSADERRHLLLLAGQPMPAADTVPGHLPVGVQRLMDRLTGTPIAVYDATWTLLTWNALWAALVGDPGPLRGRDRNLLWRYFTGGGSRVEHPPGREEIVAAALVADLRAATGRYPGDASLRALVRDLRTVSPQFAAWWDRGEVGRHQSDTKSVRHPELGPIALDCDVLTVEGSDLRIVAYTAEPGSVAADRLALLAVVGTQQFAG